MVAITETDERLVGQIAKRQAITNADNTIYAVKRLIGRKFDSPEVKKSMARRPLPGDLQRERRRLGRGARQALQPRRDLGDGPA